MRHKRPETGQRDGDGGVGRQSRGGMCRGTLARLGDGRFPSGWSFPLLKAGIRTMGEAHL